MHSVKGNSYAKKGNDDHLNFNQQTKELCCKAASQLNVLQRLARHLDQGCRMSIFRAFILTHFNYCALVWNFCGATNTKKLERIQCRALRFVFLDFNSDYTTLLVRAGLPTLELARKREILYTETNALQPEKLEPTEHPTLEHYEIWPALFLDLWSDPMELPAWPY